MWPDDIVVDDADDEEGTYLYWYDGKRYFGTLKALHQCGYGIVDVVSDLDYYQTIRRT